MSTASQYGLRLARPSSNFSSCSSLYIFHYTQPIRLASTVTSTRITNSSHQRHDIQFAHIQPHRNTTRFYSTPSATYVNHNTAINPPSSTLPPHLVLPERAKDQSAPSYYFSLGKAYLSFYKTGALAVYSNFQLSRKLQARLPSSTSLADAVSSGLLSRGEWQLIRRSKQDIKKVPLFAVVFMICGEFTPLVVVFMTGVVPRTCMIPSQVVGVREKVEKRRNDSFRNGTISSPNDLPNMKVELEDLKPEYLTHVGRILGLYPALFDRLGLGMPSALLKRRVRGWKEYIDLDDKAIQRNGGVEQLEVEELKIACQERGLDVLGKNDEQMRKVLRNWLQARKNTPVATLLLTRPNVWGKGM